MQDVRRNSIIKTNLVEVHLGVGQNQTNRDPRFWSMVPLTRVPFWYRFFDPQPFLVAFYQSCLSTKQISEDICPEVTSLYTHWVHLVPRVRMQILMAAWH